MNKSPLTGQYDCHLFLTIRTFLCICPDQNAFIDCPLLSYRCSLLWFWFPVTLALVFRRDTKSTTHIFSGFRKNGWLPILFSCLRRPYSWVRCDSSEPKRACRLSRFSPLIRPRSLVKPFQRNTKGLALLHVLLASCRNVNQRHKMKSTGNGAKHCFFYLIQVTHVSMEADELMMLKPIKVCTAFWANSSLPCT